ncbi:MAG: hypothetical protein HYR96_07450, partial [Deltaproteobacteria bacterium]|nr:hypothetical protein [Deltaproteobacteria bacterium]
MPQFRSQDYSAFALGLMAVLLIKIIYYPSLTLHPQIWEEGATNFFFTAHHQGLIKNLIQYDAGYLPWFPRLVAVVTELARIPVAWVPAVYQWTAIIFIASSSAILALPHFRGVVRSDWIRLAIVLALGFFEEYQSHV